MAYFNCFLYFCTEESYRGKFFKGADIPKLFPSANKIRDSLPVILEEIDAAVNGSHILDGDPNLKTITKDRKWRGLYLRFYGPLDPLGVEKCPKTCALLSNFPEVKVAFISVLGPGGHITPHNGPYKGIIRYHLGIKTPNDDKCALTVAGDHYSWRDGEHMMFDDTYNHEVRNFTDTTRAILFVDVVRPFKNPIVHFLNRTLIRLAHPFFHRWNSYQEKTE